MKFCEKLIELRRKNKLSQEQFADMLNVSRQSVSKWELGTSYPEMDKLLNICKLFKCDLKYLTDDTIKEEEYGYKTEKTNFIENIIDFFNESIDVIKNFSTQEIKGFMKDIFVMILALVAIAIVFDNIKELPYGIFELLPFNLGRILYELWSTFINIINLIFSILIMYTTFKKRYLDDRKPIVKELKVKDAEGKPAEEEQKRTYIKSSDHYKKTDFINKTSNVIITLFIIGIKTIIGLMSLILPFFLVMGSFCLAVSIFLAFKEIVFIGIILFFLFCIIITANLIELIVGFIFDKEIYYKKILSVFIVSLVGIGLSLGLTVYEFSNIDYKNELSPKLLNSVFKFELNNDEKLGINIYHGDVHFVETDTDKILVEYYYSGDDQDIKTDKANEKVYLIKYGEYEFKEIVKIILNDLKNNTLYNYDFYKTKIIIYANKENIERLKDTN